MKFLEKLRKLGKRSKIVVSTAIATMSMATIACVASAAETTGSALDMDTVMKNAGDSLLESFNGLITTMIPVILGMIGGGIVIFGLIGLFKLVKRVFGHVTG